MNDAHARTVSAAARRVAQAPLQTPVLSPCISVCQMDEASGFCEGCLRTIDEIMGWGARDEAAKRAIWQQLAQRAEEVLSPTGPRP